MQKLTVVAASAAVVISGIFRGSSGAIAPLWFDREFWIIFAPFLYLRFATEP